MPPKRKAKKPKIGFDYVVDQLDKTFYNLLSAKLAPPTAHGYIKTAHQCLKFSFASSMKYRKSPTTPSTRSALGIARAISVHVQLHFNSFSRYPFVRNKRPLSVCSTASLGGRRRLWHHGTSRQCVINHVITKSWN